MKDPITIFDINTPDVDRFYVWTALTRATDLSQVTIFKHSKMDILRLRQSRIKRYIEDKISGYKQQDKLAERKVKKNEYIYADWVADEHEKSDKCYVMMHLILMFVKVPLHQT